MVDADHRVWGVPNLFVCDGSVMPTQGAANPALTIMALASRLAGDAARAHGRGLPAAAAAVAHERRDRATARVEVGARYTSRPTRRSPTARSRGTRRRSSSSQAHAGGARGLGYTYGAAAVGRRSIEAHARATWSSAATRSTCPRRVGGDAARAAQRRPAGPRRDGDRRAVDIALWDLKARLLGVPLARRCSAASTSAVPVYGSGGFTSYSDERLAEQLGGWVGGRASRA